MQRSLELRSKIYKKISPITWRKIGRDSTAARARDRRVGETLDQRGSTLNATVTTASCSSPSTMMATPKRGVHWNFDDISLSELNSPSGSSTDSFVSTSTLEYANAQLIAHGFVQAPGLCLEGISVKDSEKVVKCLLGLLSQRVVCGALSGQSKTWPHARL